MELNINSKSYFVFDLDDTLVNEIEFVHSGFRHIAHGLNGHAGRDIYPEMQLLFSKKENVFEWLLNEFSSVKNLTKESLLNQYRYHLPLIALRPDAARLLQVLAENNIPAGLITDGRSRTQRNKLKSLGLENYFSDILISEEFGSEKPDPLNFLFFQNKYPDSEFLFFGDNTKKDFKIPLQLGWKCFCLKDGGFNIHPQSTTAIDGLRFIASFDELTLTGILQHANN